MNKREIISNGQAITKKRLQYIENGCDISE